MTLSTRLGCGLLFAALVFPLAGCGGGGYKVTGKLVSGGTPVKTSEKGMIQMSFIEESDKDATNPFPVSVNMQDGTFKVASRGNLSGPPAGKYRVSVRIFDPYPGQDKLGDKFSPQNSKLFVEVKGNDDLTVDIAKGG